MRLVFRYTPYFIVLILLILVVRLLNDRVAVNFPNGVPECPVSSLDAAELFGASMDRWEKMQNVVCGWSLKSQEERVSVLIPNGYRMDCWDGFQKCAVTGSGVAKEIVSGTMWKIQN